MCVKRVSYFFYMKQLHTVFNSSYVLLKIAYEKSNSVDNY